MTETEEKTALVTGGHGFLGSHLVDLLLEHGFTVRCLLRPERDAEVLGDRPVSVVRGDLRRRKGLEQAAQGADFVFHVAGLIAARGASHFRAVNTWGTRRLARAVRRAAPDCRRFVYVSSQAAAGPSPDGRPLVEQDPPRPVSHYGRSKLEAERLLRRALGPVPATIVRPPAIYGPRDKGILPFFRWAAHGLAPGLQGRGRRFNLLYAGDVAEGILAAGLSPAAAGATYFLSDGRGYSYGEIADSLGRAFARRLRRIPMPDALLDLAATLADEWAALTRSVSVFGRQKAIELKARWWLCSAARARRELGWRPRVALDEGMERTARWYERAGRVYRRGATSL